MMNLSLMMVDPQLMLKSDVAYEKNLKSTNECNEIEFVGNTSV